MSELCVRVPGKLLLAGEYSVLTGAPCLALTINRFLTVTASPRTDGALWIDSDLFGRWQLGTESRAQRLESILEAALAQQPWEEFPGLNIAVSSELKIEYGLGSSSALELALRTALSLLRDPFPAPDFLWDLAAASLDSQRQAQGGQASGYDLATQLSGGLCEYTLGPSLTRASIRPLPFVTEAFSVYVGGRGAPTGALLSELRPHVTAGAAELRVLNAALCRSLEAALNGGPLPSAEIAAQREFFRGTAAYPEIFEVLRVLPGADKNFSFKATGAGGEDALLLWGSSAAAHEVLLAAGWQPLQDPFTERGLSFVFEQGSHDAQPV